MPSYTAGKPESKSGEFFLPAGAYKFRVIESKDDSSSGGNAMIKLKIRLIKKDGTDGPSNYDYLVFNPKCFWKIDQFLKSVGKHPGEGKDIDIKAEELIGAQGEVSVKVETYEGNKENKVVNYLFEEF
jgi:hypothetical protein